MHAAWARLNNTFFLALMVLGVCAGLATFLDYTPLVIPKGGKDLTTELTDFDVLALYVFTVYTCLAMSLSSNDTSLLMCVFA